MIRYANGIKEVNTPGHAQVQVPIEPKQDVNGFIERRGLRYYENDSRLSENELFNLIADSKNSVAIT